MTPLDPKTREQLCAWMDGELSAEEARFLERRIAHDGELRAQWERWQLASACIRGQLPLPMRGDFSERVLATISGPEKAAAKRRPVWGWGIAASIAALALLIGVQMRPEHSQSRPDAVTQISPISTAPISASPASADLVALNVGSDTPVTVVPETSVTAATAPAMAVKAAADIRPSVSNRTNEVASLQSPMPLNAQSPSEFPLMQTSEAKSWPRSPVSSGNDASMEAYLVRHNEMVSDGGLGGFVPYVDVVTRERDAATDPGAGDVQVSEDDKQ